MTVEIKVPELGESVVEATVGAWLKQEGDAVTAGETVLELETDKVNMEVTAPEAGQLQKIVKAVGETVNVGEVLGLLEAGAVPAAAAETAKPAAAQAAPAAAPTNGRGADAEATPVARRLAESHELDIAAIAGTGRGGRVTKEDVEAALATRTAPQPEGPPAAPPASSATATSSAPPPFELPRPAQVAPGERTEERIRLSRRKLTMATRLGELNREAVMTTTFNEIDMSAVINLRKRYREQFQERHGVGLGFMSFFVKASVGALQAFPTLNSEMQDAELVLKHYYDIGIAVSAEEGLVVPVVRDADRKGFADIEKEVRYLAARAREKKLTLEELRGGTFTITNGGVFGSMMSTPILNPPQSAILGMHAITERPMAVDGQVQVRPVMYVAVTYDHRVVEGAEAVQFLVRLKQLIEDPARLLVDA